MEGFNNIYSVMGNYNFAIHTSPHETGPLVLLEYMHASLPFLTYNTGDVVANINSQLPEAVIDSFELDDWKKRIENIMMNDEARSEMRSKMKTIIQEHYTEEGYWKELHSIYKAVLN
jgi:glycosyltransferase involved in cell wall biosynthesis